MTARIVNFVPAKLKIYSEWPARLETHQQTALVGMVTTVTVRVGFALIKSLCTDHIHPNAVVKINAGDILAISSLSPDSVPMRFGSSGIFSSGAVLKPDFTFLPPAQGQTAMFYTVRYYRSGLYPSKSAWFFSDGSNTICVS